jgi:hypothetical protein
VHKFDPINDNNGTILLIATIPVNNNHNPLILPNTSDSDTSDDKDQCEDKENNKDNLSNDDLNSQEADEPEKGLTANKDQGVHKSKRNNKGITAKYADYGLMMNTRQAKGGHSRATIHGGLVFFSAEDLNKAKPILEDDRLEWALGIVLVHYSMKAGIKKFQDRGKAGVSKELTQMHDMEVFHLVIRDSLTKVERAKAITSLIFLKEKRDHSVKARMCANGQKKEGTGQNRTGHPPPC